MYLYYYRHYIPIIGIIWAAFTLGETGCIYDSDAHLYISGIIQGISASILIFIVLLRMI